jgi:hypothetical protein
MNQQLSQDYSVDARYSGLEQAQDNSRGRRFALSYLKALKSSKDIPSEKIQEDRFTFSGPGQGVYSFLNAFRTKQ